MINQRFRFLLILSPLSISYAVLALGQTQSGQATVGLKDGSEVQGQVQGRIVFATPGARPVLFIVDGANISTLKSIGLGIKADTVLTRIGRPWTSSEDIWKMPNEQILNLALAAADKKEPAVVPFNLKLEALMSGNVDGPGRGSVAVGNRGRIIYFREKQTGTLAQPLLLLGEIQDRAGSFSILATIRVAQQSGMREIAVSSIPELTPKK